MSIILEAFCVSSDDNSYKNEFKQKYKNLGSFISTRHMSSQRECPRITPRTLLLQILRATPNWHQNTKQLK